MGKLSNLKPTPRLRGRAGQEQRHRRMMRTDYLCVDCQAEGRTTIAEEVHHIIPLHKGGSDADANTVNLCREHHLKRESKTVRNRVGADGWPLD